MDQYQNSFQQRECAKQWHSPVSEFSLPHPLLPTLDTPSSICHQYYKGKVGISCTAKKYLFFSWYVEQLSLNPKSTFDTHMHDWVPLLLESSTKLFRCFPVSTKKSKASKNTLQRRKCYSWNVVNNIRSFIVIRQSWNDHSHTNTGFKIAVCNLIRESLWQLCMRSLNKQAGKVFSASSLKSSSRWNISPDFFVCPRYTPSIQT